MAPQWSDLVLASHVPNSEADVLVFNGFNVEAWLHNDYDHDHRWRPTRLKQTFWYLTVSTLKPDDNDFDNDYGYDDDDADVPHVEADVLEFNRFNVEAWL